MRAFMILSGIAFAFALGAELYVLAAIDAALPKGEPDVGAYFHFIAVLPEASADEYFSLVAEGMRRAGRDSGAAVQVLLYPESSGSDGAVEALRMARELQPDGVVAAAPDGPGLSAALSALVSDGVPVVTLEFDSPSSGRAAFVGTNTFQAGYLAGSLVASAFPDGARAALVVSRFPGEGPERANNALTGFRKGVGSKVEVVELPPSPQGPFGGEAWMREALASSLDLDAVAFSGSRESIGAAQALIEFNRVGRPALVGFGDAAPIRELIAQGVMLGSVARSPSAAGEACVRALVALRRGGATSAFVDPGLELVLPPGDL
jgi:ribose transport system substrate-binding protein